MKQQTLNILYNAIIIFSISFVSCKQVEHIQVLKNDVLYPKNLSVECIRQPQNVLIIDSNPEFAWKIPNSIISQSAYQILVASSKEKIENNIGDVWDSGKVLSNQVINIEFKGENLEVGNTFYWKVRAYINFYIKMTNLFFCFCPVFRKISDNL